MRYSKENRVSNSKTGAMVKCVRGERDAHSTARPFLNLLTGLFMNDPCHLRLSSGRRLALKAIMSKNVHRPERGREGEWELAAGSGHNCQTAAHWAPG